MLGIIFMELLADRDIFSSIASEWLELKDLVNLDTAVLNKDLRLIWSDLLQFVTFKIPFQNQMDKWWKHHKACLGWAVRRSMFDWKGELNVHLKLWNYLLKNSDPGYLKIIERLQALRFLGFAGNEAFNYFGLEKCAKLQQLRICNLYESMAPQNLSICPQLQILEFHNTTINNQLLQSFSNCEKLKQIVFAHVKYDHLSLSFEYVQRFAQKIQEVKVLNNIPEFVLRIGNAFTNVTKLSLDQIQPQESLVDISSLLSHAPLLKELCIDRITINYSMLFHMISKHNRNVQILHLNHCRLISDSDTSLSTDSDGASGVGISHLCLSTIITSPLSNHFVQIILLNRQYLQRLNVSFCEDLDDAAYKFVVKSCSALISVQIEDKKERFGGHDGQDKLLKLIKALDNVTQVRIVVWPHWVRENDKAKNWGLREVLYEKNTFDRNL